ncbi:copper amine oxidase [Lasiosphaeria miniovina]|uniref:Amine oxidase n=1 Tax=Lasiosphaeria miniovina TaxID=1954250 RepID=A0AA40ADN4_9PEZI|nr:copper amine oxidase [Lasiosphaeria miniovina]KAK0714012.1 copper amine oxidase [Lasiosphaeria miniovina]
MITQCLLAALVATATPVAARPDAGFWRRAMSFTNGTTPCGLSDSAPTVKAPKANPWSSISPADAKAVYEFVHAPETGLNLTASENATLTDNYVWFIDTLNTNKSQILPYIDGNEAAPPKYARVVIFEGGKAEPVSQEYMVGPLPFSSDTTIQKYDFAFNGGKGGQVPYNGRYFDGKRSAAVQPLLKAVMTEVADITVALFDGAYLGSADKGTNLTAASTTPTSRDGETAYLTFMFRYPGLASYMTPIDLFVLLDITGTDASKYALKGYVTNERFFATASELRAAFDAGELTSEFPQTRDQTWALLDHKPETGVRDLEDRLAPQSIEIGGKRYKVDVEQQYVEYMGWSFYMAFTRTLGLQFYDIKFKGDRVLYELTLQEAAAQYAGFQPKAAGTVHPDAICIFEADDGFPLARHRSGSGNAYGFANIASVKSTTLHARTVATVGNYDYLFDYAFHLDGSLDITARASGYLQSSPYYKSQARFGSRISQGTQGSFHDHVLTYKADFDVAGASNSLEVTELVVVNQTQPWYPELGSFEQMEYRTSNMATEAQFNWAANGQTMYCVVNNNATNAWGEKRGYRLVPGRSNVHLSIRDSPFTRKSSSFLKSHLAVTQQHDTEVYANSWQNVNLAEAPQHDFLKFFDGESVDDTDLVVWFNLGMHHFTRAEDVPVTLYTEAVSSISFAPHNFNDRAQEGDLLNRRWIVPDADGVLAYDDYGVTLPTCQIELDEPATKIEPWVTI